MAEVLEYKCPCCGGAIAFDPDAQKLKCPYCDTEFELEILAAYDEQLRDVLTDDMKWERAGDGVWQEGETEGLYTYVCPSCGGAIVGDETMAATACPYCGNPVVIPEQFAGMLRPDYVIPFKFDRDAAVNALKLHYKGKRLLPKAFSDENHLREIKGLYVPVWLHDTGADANMRFRATKIHTWSDANYIYTKTSYFSVLRAGSIAFDNIPVDGSVKMDDTMMESIEPFDFSEAVDFRTAYLAGFFADKYDVSAEESETRANDRVRSSTQAAFADTVTGYSSVTQEACAISLRNGKVKYALYPVWMLTTRWQEKNYTFIMNGQTGKFAGDLPMDKGAWRRWFFGIAAAVTACAFALLSLAWFL